MHSFSQLFHVPEKREEGERGLMGRKVGAEGSGGVVGGADDKNCS